MTDPKQKAIELVERFHQFANCGKYEDEDTQWENAKDCALICCDQVIEAIDWHEFETPNKEYEFWTKVKEEITKM